MCYTLYDVIVREGIEEDDMNERVVSAFLGFLMIIAIDVIMGLKLSELVIQSFIGLDGEDLGSFIPPLVISILSGIGGAIIAWQVHRKMNNRILARRYFVLISTMILFCLIRVYVVAYGMEDPRPMVANLAFIIGYGLILINSPKISPVPNE